MSTGDRRDLFQAASVKHGVSAAVIEKDFWVCWCLKHLFALPNMPAMLFKGGTSLSKVYDAINRFSEDVDISLDRSDLGFRNERDPARAGSGKKAEKLKAQLNAVCSEFVCGQLWQELSHSMRSALVGTEEWNLVPDEDDPDKQTLLFYYPCGSEITAEVYIAPYVRLEFGARSDHWPHVSASVEPYTAKHFPNFFDNPTCEVRVLSAKRTFWEKATILHMLYHIPVGKKPQIRQSRHYYDVYMLSKTTYCEEALNDLNLLQAVVQHKTVFFKSAWANYERAKPGTMHLVPGEALLDFLINDHEKMDVMIFGESPDFQAIVGQLQILEDRINRPG